MESQLLNFGIIGAGNRGIDCFGRLIEKHEQAQVTAIFDTNQVRAKNASARLENSPTCYEKLEDMLNGEKLDAVVITSPDYCHEDNAVAALERGVNVLIDKPLAINVAACKNIISTAEKHNSTAYMGFNLRHDPTLKRLKKFICDGELGRIIFIENREFYHGGRTYMSRWNRKYALSGGLWIHKGSHDFDIFNWLLDFPRPKKVSAFAGINVFNTDNYPFEIEAGLEPGPTCSECHYKNICPDVYDVSDDLWGDEAIKVDNYAKNMCMYSSDKDVHDNGVAIVEYENGVRASHMECFVTGVNDRRYSVVGTKAQAEVSLTNRTIKITPRWDGVKTTYEVPPIIGGHGGSDPALLDTFIDILRGDSEKHSSLLEHGLLSTSIGQAAEIASREERVVFMNELLD